VKCEEIRQFLPDLVLGTLSETESTAVRRHLRGCSGCRAEAVELDEGVALFARAAHAAEPPVELRDRVMSVLEEEWAEAPARPTRGRGRFVLGWQAVAALVIVLAGVATWAGVAQGNASRFREDAASYRGILGALGGKDFRVGKLIASSGATIDGTVVMYDSDGGQSWVMVLARAPGLTDDVTVTLAGADRTIKVPFPLHFESDGEGWTGLVTAADLTTFDRVSLTDPSGRTIARARIVSAEKGGA
jgi:anti-sigma factor RsiW